MISFAKDVIYVHPVVQERVRALIEADQEISFTLFNLLNILRLNFVKPLTSGEQKWPELVALHPTVLVSFFFSLLSYFFFF